MKEFKMYADVVYQDSFRAFIQAENIGEADFILTNEFLYNEFVKPLQPQCGALFIEAYGQGEPTTDMVDAIKKDIPAGVKRLIAVGGGSVIDIAKMLSLHVPSGKTEDLSSARKPRRVFTTSMPCPPPAAPARRSPTPARSN